MKGKKFPCHIYEVSNAEEAYENWQGELVKSYGEYTALEDGTKLHDNYAWDEGSRVLMRCNDCGGLIMMQQSVYNDMFDGPDGYYKDWVPVSTVAEGDLLNILMDAAAFEEYPYRHLRGNNKDFCWTEGDEPVPYDTEGLVNQIRKQYTKLGKRQKVLLERLLVEVLE